MKTKPELPHPFFWGPVQREGSPYVEQGIRVYGIDPIAAGIQFFNPLNAYKAIMGQGKGAKRYREKKSHLMQSMPWTPAGTTDKWLEEQDTGLVDAADAWYSASREQRAKWNPWNLTIGKPGGMNLTLGRGRQPYRRRYYAGPPGEPMSANQRMVSIALISTVILGTAFLLTRNKNEQAEVVGFQPSLVSKEA